MRQAAGRVRDRSAVIASDLMVALTADIEGLTVLHHDGDFDIIPAVTGQPAEWS